MECELFFQPHRLRRDGELSIADRLVLSISFCSFRSDEVVNPKQDATGKAEAEAAAAEAARMEVEGEPDLKVGDEEEGRPHGQCLVEEADVRSLTFFLTIVSFFRGISVRSTTSESSGTHIGSPTSPNFVRPSSSSYHPTNTPLFSTTPRTHFRFLLFYTEQRLLRI